MIAPDRSTQNLAKYGLTKKQFNRMYREQKGLCIICSKRMLGRDCHIDHDHDSDFEPSGLPAEIKVVRGLLCGSCNTGLGMFKDSIRLLAGAIVYLESHGKSFPETFFEKPETYE